MANVFTKFRRGVNQTFSKRNMGNALRKGLNIAGDASIPLQIAGYVTGQPELTLAGKTLGYGSMAGKYLTKK